MTASESTKDAQGVVLSEGSQAGSFIWQPTFGSEHPVGHGPITFELTTNSGKPDVDTTITGARIRVHLAHRGAEKLFETRDYRQMMMLGDRHDWNSSFGSELGLALTIEQALGITAPERATWLRTLMAELNRVIHHLRWLGESAGELDGLETREQTALLREQLVELHESYSGGRLHPMLVQPGGMRLDVPKGWLDQLGVALEPLARVQQNLTEFFGSDVPGMDAGHLSLEDAKECGASGPVARASGLELDLRFDDSYCAYPELIERGILRRHSDVDTRGNNQARFMALVDELSVSAACIAACTEHLGTLGTDEPISVKLPRSIRLPHGNFYGWTENPTGINGWFITSTGGPTPYRVKLRTASFNNAQALEHTLVGLTFAELKPTLMSWQLTSGDLAK